MREYATTPHKFRFWDYFNEVMKYSSEYDSLAAFFADFESAAAGENKPIFMYCIGRDDAGNDLYEHDIVETNYGEFKVGVLDFYRFTYILRWHSLVQSLHDLNYHGWKIKVKGNVYQNPELIK